MLVDLKRILNTYSDYELKDMTLYINSSNEVKSIIIDEYSIDLITKGFDIKVEKE